MNLVHARPKSFAQGDTLDIIREGVSHAACNRTVTALTRHNFSRVVQ